MNNIITRFEEFVKQEDEFWKTIEEISKICNCTKEEILEYIHNNDGFVKNTKNKFTTRNLYNKRTPFLDKFIDSMINTIR